MAVASGRERDRYGALHHPDGSGSTRKEPASVGVEALRLHGAALNLVEPDTGQRPNEIERGIEIERLCG